MTHESTPKRLLIKTALKGEIEVTCPVCAYDQFMSVRASTIAPGVGFQHLTLGQEVVDGTLGSIVALPVRFHACANCGLILKFLMSRP